MTEPGSRSGGTETTNRAKLSGARSGPKTAGPATWARALATSTGTAAPVPTAAGSIDTAPRGPPQPQASASAARRPRRIDLRLPRPLRTAEPRRPGSPAWPGTCAPGHRRRCRSSGLFGAFDLTEHRGVSWLIPVWLCRSAVVIERGGFGRRSLRALREDGVAPPLGCRRMIRHVQAQVSGLTSAWAAPRARSIASRASRVRSWRAPRSSMLRMT